VRPSERDVVGGIVAGWPSNVREFGRTGGGGALIGPAARALNEPAFFENLEIQLARPAICNLMRKS
jgi:hypothetical protein